ncbi:MAG: hypothetical protein COT43_11025 [Candidatus Marinimicrobia bacterium CG08_land_8_20_14_0_20_45_22]|nr:MAG: hypothetical protein COT43_11025 [Candidatus Marinimicrobia bacterium CG08_land_8_20_14_0_20_45_22]
MILREKKRISALLAITVLFTLVSSVALGNSRYYSSVQQICKAYQIEVDYNRMSLIETANGTKDFSLTINSARNNFDRIMLIGFYAAGKAMLYLREDIQTVNIIVNVEYKSVENIMATAVKEDILAYVDGKMSSADFVRKIKFS